MNGHADYRHARSQNLRIPTTAEAGIRQFLDIGTGLPTSSNVHEVAQQIAPSSRVVYVDNDHCKSSCAHAVQDWSGCLKWTRERKPSERP
jgi:hypothetical protein